MKADFLRPLPVSYAPATHGAPRKSLALLRAVQSKYAGYENFTRPRQAADVAVVAPEQLSKRLKVLTLVASYVQINSDLARFEVLAGRSAMVGFTVAFCAELLLPYHGLFGALGNQSYSAYAALTVSLISSATVLAGMSKRRLGLKFQEAVLTSLTALSRSASSITQANVDSAVDYVFEQVFRKSFVDANLIDIDDFI